MFTFVAVTSGSRGSLPAAMLAQLREAVRSGAPDHEIAHPVRATTS